MPADPAFRQRLLGGEDAFLIMTVGSFTGLKGHAELLEAFGMMNLEEPAVLMLNGNTLGLSPVRARSAPRRALRALTGRPNLGNSALEECVIGARRLTRRRPDRRVLITDLGRAELVQAYLAADLFAFASRIEYSPLVLFEAAAAGTPFLSVPVGNAREIAEWTGGGRSVPLSRTPQGRRGWRSGTSRWR